MMVKSDSPAVQKRAVIYCRVSTKEQEEEGFSIPAQLKLLSEYAATRGFEVVREFVDVETAKQAGRTEFGEMVRFLGKGSSRCRTILVEKTDRLYRNPKDWVTLDEMDVETHLVKENGVLSRDSRSSEKLMHGIRVVMAKHFVDNLREEVVKGMGEKVAQGHWPHKAPVGYRNAAGPDGKRIIEQDPETAPIVRKIFERFATGNYSVKQVAKIAVVEGLVFRKSRRPICVSTIHKALRSPLYKGEVTWRGRTFPGAHDPLVSVEVWDRVQSTLTSRVRGTDRKNSRGLPFVSLLRCGHCGCSLTTEVKRRKKKQYVYYRCTYFRGKCPGRYATEEELDQLFAGYFARLHLDEEVAEVVLACLKEDEEERSLVREKAFAAREKEMLRIEGRLDILYEDRLDGRLDPSGYDRRSTPMRAQLQRLREEDERAREETDGFLADAPLILSLAQEAGERYLRASVEDKRKLIRVVLLNTRWKDGELLADYREPFARLAVVGDAAKKEGALERVDSGGRPGWYP